MPGKTNQNSRQERIISNAASVSNHDESLGTSLSPPPFQFMSDENPTTLPNENSNPRTIIQRYEDASQVVGNVSGSTNRGNHLSDNSNRRIVERIAMLEGRNAAQAGEEYAALSSQEKETALETVIIRFQNSQQGQALIQQIEADNNTQVGNEHIYRQQSHNLPIQASDATRGSVRNNDATMQALANAWPKNILGVMVNEEQAYDFIHALVTKRNLPFNEADTNVISVRSFQGGQIHDNNEGDANGPFQRRNRYNDTTYILSQSGSEKHVVESRSTVDPGDNDDAHNENAFSVAADQQWDYVGNSRGNSNKYDRPMYSPDPRTNVNRGTYWVENREELERAIFGNGRDRTTGHEQARVISNREGRQFADVNAEGEANRVSAIHSGGRGNGMGDIVNSDSTGCTVIHGAWYAHFNESLRRSRNGASEEDNSVNFTYTLLDLRLIDSVELNSIIAEELPSAS